MSQLEKTVVFAASSVKFGSVPGGVATLSKSESGGMFSRFPSFFIDLIALKFCYSVRDKSAKAKREVLKVAKSYGDWMAKHEYFPTAEESHRSALSLVRQFIDPCLCPKCQGAAWIKRESRHVVVCSLCAGSGKRITNPSKNYEDILLAGLYEWESELERQLGKENKN